MADVLTAEQRAAVENRGRSLLVSAAAGSGKTKVLVERLFSYIEGGEANLDDFLIITYTRAAAAELRGKIAKVLGEKLQEDPANAHLQRQMLRVYRADIKTVDAFCTALLRENCHLLREDARGHALRPDFRVLDENEAQLLRERVLARTLDEFYETMREGDGASLLADTLGAGRDDRALAALVLELHGKLQAQPYMDRWLAEQERLWRELPPRAEDTVYGELLLSMVRRKALHCASLLRGAAEETASDAALADKYAPLFLGVAEQFTLLAAAAEQDWDAAAKRRVDFPRLTAVRKCEDEALKARMQGVWNGCKKTAKSFDDVFAVTSTEAMEDLRAMAPAMLALLRLTADFSRAYQEEKRRRNAADFSDQEHEAIGLLVGEDGQPTDLARMVSQRYREIMVDEYQDTNEVQNCIFSAISREGKNLFTVGDVKQSIYRFRLADPRIFLDHYLRYPHAAGAAEGESAKLLLSKNFRSRDTVLDAANFVFRSVLSREMGELDYGEDEALHVGAGYPENPACRTEFHLVDLSARDDDAEKLRAARAEADFVADYIQKMLTSGFAVQDEKTHEPRAVREEDVVILMRSPRTRLADYRRALDARGLHCAAESDGGFYETMEVAVTFALLEILDNPRQDVPLISVLRSPLFGFTPDRLAELRAKTPTGDFYDALRADDGEDSARFLALLDELRGSARTLTLTELVAALYGRCRIPAVFGAMQGGDARRENLRAFFSLAEEFERGGGRGLFDFVRHLRELLESGEPPVPQTTHAARGVRIMSIHKSKGLEFPVVILADLARAFSRMDFQSSVLVHPEYGLGPVCVDVKRSIKYPTVARLALERTLRREAKAEELRVLYVAMTRAKEKLVMVCTRAGAAKHLADLCAVASCPVRPETVEEQSCMADWILLPLLCRPEAAPLRELAGADAMTVATGDAPWRVEVHAAGDSAPAGRTARERAEEAAPELPLDTAALEWRYPYALETTLSAKLTATQLKGRALDEEIAENAPLPPRLRSLARPKFLTGERPLTPAEQGTAMHAALQFLDFSTPADEDAVRAAVAEMETRRLVTPEQARAVDASALARFLRSPLCARIRAAGEKARHEYRFSLLESAATFVPEARGGDEILLQGVADCFFEEDGALVVVDFKTDRVAPDALAGRAEHYRPQLEAYSLALARVIGKPVKEKLLYFLRCGEQISL